MLTTYNRQELMRNQSGPNGTVLYESHGKTGLEWNQYIGQVIINDFIKQLPQCEGLDFDPYIKDVVPYIQLGLFDSAIAKINQISISGLEKIQEWLLKSLHEGEDRQLPNKEEA